MMPLKNPETLVARGLSGLMNRFVFQPEDGYDVENYSAVFISRGGGEVLCNAARGGILIPKLTSADNPQLVGKRTSSSQDAYATFVLHFIQGQFTQPLRP